MLGTELGLDRSGGLQRWLVDRRRAGRRELSFSGKLLAARVPLLGGGRITCGGSNELRGKVLPKLLALAFQPTLAGTKHGGGRRRA